MEQAQEEASSDNVRHGVATGRGAAGLDPDPRPQIASRGGRRVLARSSWRAARPSASMARCSAWLLGSLAVFCRMLATTPALVDLRDDAVAVFVDPDRRQRLVRPGDGRGTGHPAPARRPCAPARTPRDRWRSALDLRVLDVEGHGGAVTGRSCGQQPRQPHGRGRRRGGRGRRGSPRRRGPPLLAGAPRPQPPRLGDRRALGLGRATAAGSGYDDEAQ